MSIVTEENYEKPVRISSLQAKIQTWKLPNMKEC